MSVPVFNAAQAFAAGTWSASKTGSFDIGTGDPAILAMAETLDHISGGANRTNITSLVIGGQTMTADTEEEGLSGSQNRRRFFRLAPGHGLTGSQAWTLTLADGSSRNSVMFASYKDVATIGARTSLAETSSDNISSGAISSNANSLVVGLLHVAPSSGGTLAANSPTVERLDASQGYLGQLYVLEEAGATSTTLQATSSGGAFTAAWTGYALSLEGTASAPVITGPSGAPGAASIAMNAAENGTAIGTWTATDGGTWSISGGADAAQVQISVGGVVTFLAGNNFEAPDDVGGNGVYNFTVQNVGPGGTSTQDVAVTLTNVAEPAVFSGTISVPALTVGVAMANINVASFFTAVDGGDTGTYSLIGGAIPGLSVSSDGTTFGGTPSAAGSYTARRVDRVGSNGLTVPTNTFTVTVNAASSGPTIDTHPSNQTAQIGAAATFAVAATTSGGALSYQWRLNGSPISGATSASYVRSGVVLGDHGGVYTCAVTDSNGTTVSNGATLTVAVTFGGTVPPQSGATGAAFSLDLSSYFAGGLSRTFAVLSGTLPTGVSQVGSTAVFSGTLGVAGSGSFVVRATDSASNTAQTGTISWTISAALATTATFLLTTDGTTPAANLSGLKFAFHDEATPDLWSAPKLKGANGSTNGSGIMTLNITGVTGLAPGQIGSVVATNSDGTPSQGAALRFTFKCLAVS